MRGFQLWLNLPARDKMKPAAYRDIPASEIPEVTLPGQGKVRIIAGTLQHGGVSGGSSLDGPVSGPIHGGSTDPYYFDIQLPADQTFQQQLPAGHNAFLYLIEGKADVDGHALKQHSASILDDAGEVIVSTGAQGARFLLSGFSATS